MPPYRCPPRDFRKDDDGTVMRMLYPYLISMELTWVLLASLPPPPITPYQSWMVSGQYWVIQRLSQAVDGDLPTVAMSQSMSVL
jgi:hypothetical protein